LLGRLYSRTGIVLARDDPEAVVLDLVQRRLARGRGQRLRQA
jgi:hypothetical protein